MSKIELGDDAKTIIFKISEGNPGAIRVVAEMMSRSFDGIDGCLLVLWVEHFDFCGENLWILYKDKCHENIELVAKVIRAIQMGFLTKEAVNDHRFDAANMKSVDEMVEDFKLRARRN
jgi:hypothetical protein